MNLPAAHAFFMIFQTNPGKYLFNARLIFEINLKCRNVSGILSSRGKRSWVSHLHRSGSVLKVLVCVTRLMGVTADYLMPAGRRWIPRWDGGGGTRRGQGNIPLVLLRQTHSVVIPHRMGITYFILLSYCAFLLSFFHAFISFFLFFFTPFFSMSSSLFVFFFSSNLSLSFCS